MLPAHFPHPGSPHDRADCLLGLLDIHCRFPKPTFIGDALRARVEVVEKKETSRDDRRVAVFRRQALNQRNEVVVEGLWKLLVRRRPRSVPRI